MSIKKKTDEKIVKKKSTTTIKKVVKKTTNKKAKKIIKKPITQQIEYYDLPYRYNETIVKVLAQTPNNLFVYWDILDSDRQKFIEKYGEYFFHKSKQILIIKNIDKNYTFEIDIDDFANCWYLKVEDTKCKYEIEIGRRIIEDIPNTYYNEYVYIASSNTVEVANDHVLFNNTNNVAYKNIKTNTTKYVKNTFLKPDSKDLNHTSNIIYKEYKNNENLNLDNNHSNPGSMFR